MEFVNDLENKISESLGLTKPDNHEIYFGIGHRMLFFAKEIGKEPEGVLETIAKSSKSFLEERGFKIYNEKTDLKDPYKCQCMMAEKEGRYYALIIGAKKESDFFRMSVIETDYLCKN